MPSNIKHARNIPCFLLAFSFFIKTTTTESNKYAIIKPYITGLKEFTIQLNVPGLNTINKIISDAINIGSVIFNILLYFSICFPPLHKICLTSVHSSKLAVNS